MESFGRLVKGCVRLLGAIGCYGMISEAVMMIEEHKIMMFFFVS